MFSFQNAEHVARAESHERLLLLTVVQTFEALFMVDVVSEWHLQVSAERNFRLPTAPDARF